MCHVGLFAYLKPPTLSLVCKVESKSTAVGDAGEAGVLCDEDLWEPPSPRTPRRVAIPQAPVPAGAGPSRPHLLETLWLLWKRGCWKGGRDDSACTATPVVQRQGLCGFRTSELFVLGCE